MFVLVLVVVRTQELESAKCAGVQLVAQRADRRAEQGARHEAGQVEGSHVGLGITVTAVERVHVRAHQPIGR